MINLAQDLHMIDVRRTLMLCGSDWGFVDHFHDFLAIVEHLGIDPFSWGRRAWLIPVDFCLEAARFTSHSSMGYGMLSYLLQRMRT